jgi:hypothetical protein
MRRTLAAVPLLAALALPAASASAMHFEISTGDPIDVQGDRVVIHPEGVPAAEISPGGVLRIDGRAVVTAERDRVLLERYNRRVRRIEETAIDMGLRGAEIGVTALAAAVVAVVTGDHDHVEQAVRPDAEELKDKGRRLCHDVEDLRALQDQLAVNVPAFRPYALMDDRPHCHVD